MAPEFRRAGAMQCLLYTLFEETKAHKKQGTILFYHHLLLYTQLINSPTTTHGTDKIRKRAIHNSYGDPQLVFYIALPGCTNHTYPQSLTAETRLHDYKHTHPLDSNVDSRQYSAHIKRSQLRRKLVIGLLLSAGYKHAVQTRTYIPYM